MDKNSIRINEVKNSQPTSQFSKKEKGFKGNSDQRESEKKFNLPEEQKVQQKEEKQKSTLWELYEMAQGDQIRKNNLTGIKSSDKGSKSTLENNSLMYRLYLQTKEKEIGISRKRVKKSSDLPD